LRRLTWKDTPLMSLTSHDLRADHLIFRRNTPRVRGGDRQD
jgi:hypothetical protein